MLYLFGLATIIIIIFIWCFFKGVIQPEQEYKKWRKEQRKYKVLIVGLVFSVSSYGQWVELAPTLTNGRLGIELQAGYRVGDFFTSVGYIAVINPSQPALFNLRTGAVLNKSGKNSYLFYAGAVKVLKSTDYKEQNYYTWQVGGQWHFFYYDRGTFYAAVNYSPKFLSYGIGMSFNLFKSQ
jgi:nitrite reductase/ring-hydroxylating ferredoxin subunit